MGSSSPLMAEEALPGRAASSVVVPFLDVLPWAVVAEERDELISMIIDERFEESEESCESRDSASVYLRSEERREFVRMFIVTKRARFVVTHIRSRSSSPPLRPFFTPEAPNPRVLPSSAPPALPMATSLSSSTCLS